MDPIERIIADALDARGITYLRDGTADTNGLDFQLCASGIYIECKAYHTDRTSEQMSRVENVIVIQGRHAAETFAKMISGQ